jgi:hypothetical protein
MKGAYSFDTCEKRQPHRSEAEIAEAEARKRKARTRLLSLDDLDGRTTAAKSAAALVAGLESDLGGTEAIAIGQRELVKRAALLGAICEDAEVRWLRKEQVDLNIYLSAINTMRRVLTTLGLERHARDVGSSSALSDAKLSRILEYAEETSP